MAEDPTLPAPEDIPTLKTPREAAPLGDGGLATDGIAAAARDLLGHSGGDAEPTIAAPKSKDTSAGLTRKIAEFGRYQIQEELGRGGMGVVYRAHDKTLGRDVALKVLQVAGRVDDETIERFQREARAAAALDHPNIVRVHDVGKLPSGSPYYTMEMLSGQDLAHAIADGSISPKEAVEAVRQVSLALFYAHQKGILHRDLKPQNIFLRRDPAMDPTSKLALPEGDAPTVQAVSLPRASEASRGEVHALLLDFGLAKLAESDLSAHAEGSQGRKSMQSLTRSGEIFGTPAYMPPEQTRGAKDVDARADIYSLGATLYAALAGRPPFDAGSLAELLVKVQKEDPSPPSVHNREVDVDLDTVALKCLQKDPKDRYQNAGELAEDLKHWLAGDPISARPIGLAGRLWRKARRNKAVAIPVTALSFVILVGLVLWGGFRARDHFRLRTAISETEALRGAGKLEEALVRIREAQVLAPDDHEVKGLVAGIYVQQGRSAYAEYTGHRDEVKRMEAEETAASIEKAGTTTAPLPLGKRREERAEGWTRTSALGEARRLRGVSWSAAVVAFTEALKHVDDEPEAKHTLAELYWDEYRRAEEERLVPEVQRLEPLVTKYGGKEFIERVRGEREVHVTFRLPSSFTGPALEAYLFEYRPCDDPPVLVPIPFDLSNGRAVRARVPKLTEDPSRWEPVPLAEAHDHAAAGASSLTAQEVKALEERAAKAIATRHDADAVAVLDRLTRALPEDATHPYNLACCLAQDPAHKAAALVALEEAVRRGWKDAKATEADDDLKSLREEAGFQLLLAVMRGEVAVRHVRIDGIVADSQASKLGLQAGDVLVTIDGKKIETVEDAKAAIQGAPKDKAYEVVVRRGTQEVQVKPTGGGPLGVQLAQADLTAQSPTRFPWTEIATAGPPAVAGRGEKARWGSVYRLDRNIAGRVPLAVESGNQQAGLARATWDVRLPKGSYLLWFPPGQGLYETRYPFEVARDYEWKETCDLVEADAPPLPPGMAAPDASRYWMYAPPGPYRASGDRDAQENPPRPAAVLRVPEGKPLAEVTQPGKASLLRAARAAGWPASR